MTGDDLEPLFLSVGPEAAELVAQLQRATMPPIGAQLWSIDSLRTTLAAPGTFTCLVSHGDSPGGVAVGRRVADEFELLYLGVLLALRWNGLGRQLLKEQLGRARQAGASRCHLEVAQENHPARVLYRRAGFQQVGLRKDYYRESDGRRHNALLLSKVLCGA